MKTSSATVVSVAALAISLLGLLLNVILVLVYGFGEQIVLLNVCTNFAAVFTELKHVICSLSDQKEKKSISLRTGNEAVQKLTRLRKVTSPNILDDWITIPFDQETTYASKFLQCLEKGLVYLRKEADELIQGKKQQQYSQEETHVISSAIIIDIFCTSASILSLSGSIFFAGAAYDTKNANTILAANAATIFTKILRFAAFCLEEREKASDQVRAWKAALLQLERLEEIRGRVDELCIAVGVAMALLEIRRETAEAKAAEIKQRMKNLFMQVHEHIDQEMAELNLDAHGPDTEP